MKSEASRADCEALLVKVASASHIEVLIRQALKGVPLTHVLSPPASIPAKTNYRYFSLNQSGGAWESIIRARNFGAYIPGNRRTPKRS